MSNFEENEAWIDFEENDAWIDGQKSGIAGNKFPVGSNTLTWKSEFSF